MTALNCSLSTLIELSKPIRFFVEPEKCFYRLMQNDVGIKGSQIFILFCYQAQAGLSRFIVVL